MNVQIQMENKSRRMKVKARKIAGHVRNSKGIGKIPEGLS